MGENFLNFVYMIIMLDDPYHFCVDSKWNHYIKFYGISSVLLHVHLWENMQVSENELEKRFRFWNLQAE